MLDDAGASTAIQNSPNPRKNPLVPLPEPAAQIVKDVEAILVTHTHSDHWDETAAQLLRKDLMFFGQEYDQEKFRSQGFTNARAIRDYAAWMGIEIFRTGGQQGNGEIAKAMALASGLV